MNPLVSIISPCYNGENYVYRFLDSVLSQTYDNIELIVINDGSKDKTLQVLEAYRSKFLDRGYSYTIINQENAGQSAAINQGLKVFKGKYMSWIDSDDAMTSDAIQKKVAYMEKNPNVGLALCKIWVVEFGSYSIIGDQKRTPPTEKDEFFYDFISGTNVFYTPGGFFVRSLMFRDAMPKPLQIECPREIGQNFQLILPIAFKYPIGYIDDYLFYYSVRLDSHSHENHSFEKQNKIYDIAEHVLICIANKLQYSDDTERNRVRRAIQVRTLNSKLRCLFDYKRTDGLDEIIVGLKKNAAYKIVQRKIALIIKYPALRYFIRIIHLPKRIAMKLICLIVG